MAATRRRRRAIVIYSSKHTLAVNRVADALSSIGYKGGLLCRDYEYAVLSEGQHGTRTIPLAGFARTPPSYRNACVGVVCANGLSGATNVSQHHDLGAPLVFEIDSKHVRAWGIRAKGDPEPLERVAHSQVRKFFSTHRAEWAPDRVFRAKALRDQAVARQLDFFDAGYFPLLSSMIREKLDELLRDAIRKASDAYAESHRKAPGAAELFRLVFRFVAAKTLRDRGQQGAWEGDDPSAVLDAVEAYYNTAADHLALPAIRDKRTLQATWKFISHGLHFQNLSVDDLAFVYENTLITPETRKKYGTHSTPSSIAEYLVGKLPLDELPEKKRHILEPCSGHGAFLIAAMRRLRDLLPASMSDRQRHDYLKRRLVGIEIDTFAVEVCRLSLMLADYPNPNNWRIHNEDVFAWDRFPAEVKRADCVLCNPPFEDFPAEVRNKYEPLQSVHQPGEILLRVLAHPPALLGFVLPKLFLTASAYGQARARLAEAYGDVELVALPDRVFDHSDAEAALLMAWGRRRNNNATRISCRTVDTALRKRFLREGDEPIARTNTITVPTAATRTLSVWVPRLSRLWSYLSDCPCFGQYAEVHRGVEYNIRLREKVLTGDATARQIAQHARMRAIVEENREKVFSERPKKGFVEGLQTASGTLQQFLLLRTSYLRIEDSLMRTKAHRYSWETPKLLANYVRLSRGPWRMAAVQDSRGIYAYYNIYGIWPRAAEDHLPLLAILNSPLANAYLYFNTVGKHNPKAMLTKIPVPGMSTDQKAILGAKVDRYQHLLRRHGGTVEHGDVDRLWKAAAEIDAEVLRLYDLPPVLERELLDMFEGYQRPVPFRFLGYYPKGFDAFLPLYRIISDEFERARADRLLERLEPINDQVVHEALELARGSDA